jgi:hypothetical protein
MAKSRKSPASILRFGPLMLTGVLCVGFAGAGIGMVWHRNRNDDLMRANAQRTRLIDALHKENQRLEFQFQGMIRPEALFERARALGLARPEPGQILRVEFTPVSPPRNAPPTPLHLAVQPRRP